ncbi:helix-turn-helix domain-containing protein [Gordonibacter sp. Marseille-P4307]|uniref:helix-turn-helix domain-containing protein n=1 Tax=Gordonibacter sp. Marseille-P4307 TaxID=2161815 RepID=UPI00351A832B
MLTIKDLAAYLQVSTTTVYRLIKDGALTGTRIGQSLRFTRKNVEGLLERRAVDRIQQQRNIGPELAQVRGQPSERDVPAVHRNLP